MMKAGQKDKAIRIWEQVLKASKRLDRYDRDMILTEIALDAVEFGLFDRAMIAANSIGDEEDRALIYGGICGGNGKKGREKTGSQHLGFGFENRNRYQGNGPSFGCFIGNCLQACRCRLLRFGFADLQKSLKRTNCS